MAISGTRTDCARLSAPSALRQYTVSRPAALLTPKFHSVPSVSTLGCAENGMPA